MWMDPTIDVMKTWPSAAPLKWKSYVRHCWSVPSLQQDRWISGGPAFAEVGLQEKVFLASIILILFIISVVGMMILILHHVIHNFRRFHKLNQWSLPLLDSWFK